VLISPTSPTSPIKETSVRPSSHLRRPAGALALGALAASTGALVVLPSPADAATGPTATLRRGTLTVTGTAARDVVDVTVGATEVTVDFGFDGTVDARFARSKVRRVNVSSGAGDDGLSVDGDGVGDLPITLSGGLGNDGGGVVGGTGDFAVGTQPVTINGDDGNDNLIAAAAAPTTVFAGAGDDRIDGGAAIAAPLTVSLGDGNDRYATAFGASGDHNDVVDGGLGADSMRMDGTFATESVGLTANAGHLLVRHDFRDQIDADNVEDVTFVGFGGLDESGSGDAVAVDDLSTTDVTRFTPDFSVGNGAPNNSIDTLTVRATAGNDRIVVSGAGSSTTVAGLQPLVTAAFLAPDDFLRIETLAGDDTVDTSGLPAGHVQLLIF